MKKRYGFLLTLTLLLMSACSNEEETKEVHLHATKSVELDKKEALPSENEESKSQHYTLQDISFTVPASFREAEKKEGLTTSYILFQLGGSASFNLVVEDASEYEGLTLESYVEASNASTGYTYKSDRYYEQNGYRWSELVSTFNGLELHQSTVTKDGLFYTFTYGGLPEDIETYQEAVKDVLASVTFQ